MGIARYCTTEPLIGGAKRIEIMSDPERIKLLEKALIKYVELYGFIDEAREYYIRNSQSADPSTEQKH
tara:strand:- start:248 stop:451 length:204 start_codon:yes stop_codon:yes gene_type:complete